MNSTTIFLHLLLGLLILALVGCTKKPEACMDFSIEKTEVGRELRFGNCSKNSESVTWRFGDGNLSEAENATYIYHLPGEYQIDLLAYSKNFKYKDQRSANIRVSEKKIWKIVLIEYPFNGQSLDLKIQAGYSFYDYTYSSPVFESLYWNHLPIEVDLTANNFRVSLQDLAVRFTDDYRSHLRTVRLSEVDTSPVVVKQNDLHFEVHYTDVFY